MAFVGVDNTDLIRVVPEADANDFAAAAIHDVEACVADTQDERAPVDQPATLPPSLPHSEEQECSSLAPQSAQEDVPDRSP